MTYSTLTTRAMSRLTRVTGSKEALEVALHFVRHKSNSSQPSKHLLYIPQEYFMFAKNIWRICYRLGCAKGTYWTRMNSKTWLNSNSCWNSLFWTISYIKFALNYVTWKTMGSKALFRRQKVSNTLLFKKSNMSLILTKATFSTNTVKTVILKNATRNYLTFLYI